MLEDSTNRDLLDAWRSGDHSAATVLVRRYMARLTSLASSRLSRKLARRVDAEDVVMSAFRSFFVATGRDQVDVPDDDNLWPLLVTMTLRKLCRQAAKHTADRRSIHAESELPSDVDWPGIAARDPTPTEAAMLTDEIEQLMSALSATDREILTLRLQGEQYTAIAAAVECSERSVRRAIKRIRERYVSDHEDDLTSAQESGETFDAGVIPATGEDSGRSEIQTRPMPAQPSPTPASLQSPTEEYGNIILQQMIGQGAFGRVYRAQRQSDGMSVAVKYVRKNLWKNTHATEQLIREVSVVTRLSHPGIVRHFGWGRTPRGAVFAVMELIEGTDLLEWGQSSKPSLSNVIECGIQVCDALSAAHQAGVVHADLTPRNILRRNDGSFVLTDFGFSHQLGDRSRTFMAGTPGYLAPEQLSDAFGNVSERTDIYGVGALLYFLLTTQPPITGRDVPEIIARTLSGRAIPSIAGLVPGIPSPVDQLIACCLNKEPSARPNSVDDIGQTLRQFRD